MKRGFSLIELLVVVVIIAILFGVATPYYTDYVRESKRSQALQDLDSLKQAVILHNSQEDMPYLGNISASETNPLPTLGEKDFNGLMGRYLTYVPVDPWGKNYKLDPYACFVYSEGPNSSENDDIKEYYVKDIALVKIEWEDLNNDREMSDQDLLHFYFNKSVWIDGGISNSHFKIYESNLVASSDVTLNFTMNAITGYTDTSATETAFICTISGNPTAKIGVHSLAFNDENNLINLKRYQEVVYDRKNSTPNEIRTYVPLAPSGEPLRYAIKTNPVKITPKHR